MEPVLHPATALYDEWELMTRHACGLLADAVDMTHQRGAVVAEAEIEAANVSQWRRIRKGEGALKDRPKVKTVARIVEAVNKRLPRGVGIVQRERLALQIILLRCAHPELVDEILPLMRFSPKDWLFRLGAKIDRNIELLPMRFRDKHDFAHGLDWRKLSGEQATELQRQEDEHIKYVADMLDLDPDIDALRIQEFIDEHDAHLPSEEE